MDTNITSIFSKQVAPDANSPYTNFQLFPQTFSLEPEVATFISKKTALFFATLFSQILPGRMFNIAR